MFTEIVIIGKSEIPAEVICSPNMDFLFTFAKFETTLWIRHYYLILETLKTEILKRYLKGRIK
jgi:hypothetical protein